MKTVDLSVRIPVSEELLEAFPEYVKSVIRDKLLGPAIADVVEALRKERDG